MKTTPCKATPTVPVKLTDAILGNTKGNYNTTNAHVYARIKWHAGRCGELAAWVRKPLREEDYKTVAMLYTPDTEKTAAYYHTCLKPCSRPLLTPLSGTRTLSLVSTPPLP